MNLEACTSNPACLMDHIFLGKFVCMAYGNTLCGIVTAAIWIFNLNFNIFTLSTSWLKCVWIVPEIIVGPKKNFIAEKIPDTKTFRHWHTIWSVLQNLFYCNLMWAFCWFFKNMEHKKMHSINNIKSVVCFLLGNSPASEFYVPKFRNTICSIFIGR